MTQLRRCKCGNSNYFDRLLDGIGHRGSSFSDVDAVTHDGETDRFLLQEFKREGERFELGQHWMLKALSGLLVKELPKHFTFWHVVRRDDGDLDFGHYGQALRRITTREYQDLFRAWWARAASVGSPIVVPPPVSLVQQAKPPADPLVAKIAARIARELLADEIKW